MNTVVAVLVSFVIGFFAGCLVESKINKWESDIV